MTAVATTTSSNAVGSSSLGAAKLSALIKGDNNKQDNIFLLEQLSMGDHNGEDLNVDVDAALAGVVAVDEYHPYASLQR